MIQLENQSVKYLQFPAWQGFPGIFHAFSTRWGGISPAPYSNLNVSFNVGDENSFVAENRRRLFNALGLDSQPVVKVRQVHGDQVLPVTLDETMRSNFPAGLMTEPYDALITDLKGVALSISTADCLPLLFYDMRLGVIGAAHAGWRGVAQNIASKTVDKLELVYGCDAADISVAIGPGIGPCCYRVDKPVVEALSGAASSDSSTLIPIISEKKGNVTQWRLNMEAMVRNQLLRAGIPLENIYTSGLCTSCREDWFFSHRRDKGQSGRMMAVMMMR
jgi:hypothetical protein